MTGKDSFTREIDEALLDGRVDVAVHSLKDVPSRLPLGLVLAAVPVREDPSDVLVARDAGSFADLPAGSRVGTSSPRRRAQVLLSRPDLEVTDARGNVDTRIRRLREGRWDALVLARAGLARLGRLADVTEVLPPSVDASRHRAGRARRRDEEGRRSRPGARREVGPPRLAPRGSRGARPPRPARSGLPRAGRRSREDRGEAPATRPRRFSPPTDRGRSTKKGKAWRRTRRSWGSASPAASWLAGPRRS